MLLVGGSLAGLTVASVALLGGPLPPFWLAVALVTAYFALLAWGSLDLSLEMYADVLWRAPEARGLVALTFDDGPDPSTTPRVLDVLEARGARATFFVLGERAALYPELLVRMARAGHTIGLHSYDHHRAYAFLPPTEVQRDIERCRDVVEEIVGQRPLWFRPPVGQTSPRTAEGVKRAGAEIVGWSARARDGLPRTTPERALARLEPRLTDGAIVLLHDAWERPQGAPSEGPAGVRALPALLDVLERKGLQAVSLDELVEAAGKTITNEAPGE